MGCEVTKIVNETGYALPCIIPENKPLFFSRGRGYTSFTAAKTLCRGCLVRLECGIDGINEGIARVKLGDPVTGHARNNSLTRPTDFPPVLAGLSNKEMQVIANHFINLGITKVDINVAEPHLQLVV